jgi:cbb3-type cytochrome oxidase subunit 3
MNTIFIIIIFIASIVFAYMSSHIMEEERKGKNIRLPWEKE